MTFRVCYVERREGGSPSMERVFRSIGRELESESIEVVYSKARFGNSFIETVLNLIFYRPPAADIYHITGHIHYMGLVLQPDRTLLTVHDLAVLDFRRGLRKRLIEKLYFVWPIRRLRYLTAISESTKRSLVRVSDVEPSKVEVIENPLMTPIVERQRFNAAKPTILQIGTAPNKNVGRLLQALTGLECRLHIVGHLSPELKITLDASEIEYSNDEKLDDGGIDAAYRDADVVAFCSTHEGFGLPIIEGQAAGVVVVTSDRSPMKEVAGGGALLVDPEDVRSIRSGMERVIGDGDLREKLIRKGRQNVARFDVRKIAARYLNLYSKVLEGRGTHTDEETS